METRQDPATARRRFVLWLAIVVVAGALIVLLMWGIASHQDDDDLGSGRACDDPTFTVDWQYDDVTDVAACSRAGQASPVLAWFGGVRGGGRRGSRGGRPR